MTKPTPKDAKEWKRLVERLQEHAIRGFNFELFLYGSLLTFNGLLISAFAIIVSLNPDKYDPYTVIYFFSVLLPVVAILLILLSIRKSNRREYHRILYSLYQINSNILENPKDCMAKYEKQIKKEHKNNRNFLRRVLDYVAIFMSFVNLIGLFVVIYKGGA